MSNTPYEMLDTYNMNTLFDIAVEAKLVSRSGKRPNKAVLLDLLQKGLFTADRVKATWASLTEREQTIINRLLWHPNGIATRLFERECSRARLARVGPAPQNTGYSNYNPSVPYAGADEYIGLPTRLDSTFFPDLIARLTLRGLVFSRLPAAMLSYSANNLKLQFHPGETIFIPEYVRRHLPPPTPIVTEDKPWTPAKIEGGNPAFFIRELYLYWDYVRRNEVPLLQSGLVGKRSLKAINQALLQPDPLLDKASSENETGKLLLLRLILQSMELISTEPSRLTATDTDKEPVPEIWTQELPQQIVACLEAWVNLPRDPTLDSDVPRYGPFLKTGRLAFLAELKNRTGWFEAEELAEILRLHNTNFLFGERSALDNKRHTGGSYYSMYWAGQYFNSYSALTKQLDTAENKFIKSALDGVPLFLGLTEVGYDTDTSKEWFAARLTPLGASILATLDLGSGKQPKVKTAPPALPTSDQGRVVLQPNFQILAMGPVKLSILARLDSFAERRKVDIGATEYHLSRDSVYKAQQAGLSVDEIIRLLKDITGAELPQNILRSLMEWAAHHERITFRPGVTLLQAANAEVLQGLFDNKQIHSHLVRTLTPEIALVDARHTSKLTHALLAQTMLPAVSDDQPASADHSVTIDEQGVIRPIHDVPSLHLSGRLARFAEKTEDGSWRMTPETIRRAASNRQKVLDLIQELGKLQRGALPPIILDEIKRWGAYYGDAATETVTLIEFRDRVSLDELLKDRFLKRWLTPFRASDRALALVDATKLPDVERRLAELGVQVKRGLGR